MKAVILAGGMGTRLRPLTFTIPKPLLPIGEQSILEHIVERLKRSGIDEIILSVGYQAEFVRAYCGDGCKFGVKFAYIQEDKPLGTAGPLQLVKQFLSQGEQILLMNGDIVTYLNFQELISFHNENNFDLTVAYKKIEHASPFGVLQIENHQVLDIIEKPKSTYEISTGIYIINASMIDYLPKDSFYTMPELMLQLINKKYRVGAFEVKAFWLGIERFVNVEEALTAIQDAEKENTLNS